MKRNIAVRWQRVETPGKEGWEHTSVSAYVKNLTSEKMYFTENFAAELRDAKKKSVPSTHRRANLGGGEFSPPVVFEVGPGQEVELTNATPHDSVWQLAIHRNRKLKQASASDLHYEWNLTHYIGQKLELILRYTADPANPRGKLIRPGAGNAAAETTEEVTLYPESFEFQPLMLEI